MGSPSYVVPVLICPFQKTTCGVNILIHDNSRLPAQILDLFPHVYLFIFLLLVCNKMHSNFVPATFVKETVSSVSFPL